MRWSSRRNPWNRLLVRWRTRRRSLRQVVDWWRCETACLGAAFSTTPPAPAAALIDSYSQARSRRKARVIPAAARLFPLHTARRPTKRSRAGRQRVNQCGNRTSARFNPMTSSRAMIRPLPWDARCAWTFGLCCVWSHLPRPHLLLPARLLTMECWASTWQSKTEIRWLGRFRRNIAFTSSPSPYALVCHWETNLKNRSAALGKSFAAACGDCGFARSSGVHRFPSRDSASRRVDHCVEFVGFPDDRAPLGRVLDRLTHATRWWCLQHRELRCHYWGPEPSVNCPQVKR